MCAKYFVCVDHNARAENLFVLVDTRSPVKNRAPLSDDGLSALVMFYCL